MLFRAFLYPSPTPSGEGALNKGLTQLAARANVFLVVLPNLCARVPALACCLQEEVACAGDRPKPDSECLISSHRTHNRS